MRNRICFGLISLLLATALCGCATFKLIKPKNVKWKNQSFSSVLPVGWVIYSTPGNLLSLTRDGILLQFVCMSKTKTNKELPKSKKKITEVLLLQELAEIIKNEISLTDDISDFNVLSQKPADLDGLEAFRLEYEYRNKDLVGYHGIIYGFIFKKKYYEISYNALAQHYYGESLDAFENFIREFKVKR